MPPPHRALLWACQWSYLRSHLWSRSGPHSLPGLRSSRLCAAALLALMLPLLSPHTAQCQEAALAGLTPVERGYVSQHPVVSLCVDPDWAPFERINEPGAHEGLAADLIKLVGQRTGLRFELVRTRNWDESLAASREGRCMALSFLNASPKREQWLRFTEPLLNDPNVFITREEHPYIAEPAGLKNQTIVLPRGTAIAEYVRDTYPNLRVIEVETEPETMTMVDDRKADMTLRSLIVAAYTIRKEGLFNLKVAGQLPQFANGLGMGVARTEPTVLLSILNKGVRTITAQEREEIINRHVNIQVQMGVDYALALQVAAAALALGAVFLYWTLRLRRLNAELTRVSQTDRLTGLYNRTKLDAQYRVEFDRARRYGRPLSLVMLDIDHFKRVNDELGHLMGDKMLVAIGQAALRSVRATDVLGRWGGEEFLVLCPETGTEAASVVTERIRKAVAEGDFPSGRRHGISAGVATLSPEDTPDSLLQRADTAMYEAKNSGRNKVCRCD